MVSRAKARKMCRIVKGMAKQCKEQWNPIEENEEQVYLMSVITVVVETKNMAILLPSFKTQIMAMMHSSSLLSLHSA